MNEIIESQLRQAVQAGTLLESSEKNILSMLRQSSSPLVPESIKELVSGQKWEELNDRFFRTLAFGTGGLRGRTIGRIITQAEQGKGGPLGSPEHPCVGTNNLNFFNISRAVQGIVAYLKEWHIKTGNPAKPSIAFSHDPRHFSRAFAEFAAKLTTDLGCDAFLVESLRSTPELSFAVRYTGASAGAMITASHNPPHDNGFKVYFFDGGQVVEPHASGIIEKVNAIQSDDCVPVPDAERGKLTMLGHVMDEAYMARLETVQIEPKLIRTQRDLKVVYTPIHGAGSVINYPMLDRLGVTVFTVPEQKEPDGRFPTVSSPNPEYAEALEMARKVAEKEGADLVIGTDPDDDRMGVIARAEDGTLQLLSGNQIGSLMAYYRIHALFEKGILTEQNKKNAVLIKTYMTTDLQKAIAEKAGIHCVETLTGFKYIGEKLEKYEKTIPEALRRNYRQLSETETRDLRLKHSKYFVFGGEESYGYSGADFVRDKDANAATLMFVEVAAYARSRGITVVELLEEIYRTYGYYLEKSQSLTFEGAEGAAKIAKLIDSYIQNPLRELNGVKVIGQKDFSKDTIVDSEGDRIPKEKMLILEFENGDRMAVRPSGTEPKIKYYFFTRRDSVGDLSKLKQQLEDEVTALWDAVQKNVEERLS